MSETRSIFDVHSFLGLACLPAACLVALAALPSIARAQAVVPTPHKSGIPGTASPALSAAQTAPTAPSTPTATAAHGNPLQPETALRHWGHRVITFHVTADPKDTRTPAQVRALVAQSIGLWNEKLNGLLQLRMVEDADSADVEIQFAALNRLPGKPRGKTDMYFTPPTMEIQHASLRIDEGLPSDVLVVTVVHEIGRALGISSHSHNTQGSSSVNPPLPAKITDEDVNLLRRAYPLYDKPGKSKDTVPPEK